MEGFLDFLFVVGFMIFVINIIRKRAQSTAKPVQPPRSVPSVPTTDMEGPGYVAQGLPRENARNLFGYTPEQTVPAVAPAQDRTDRRYQGISRPVPAQAAPASDSPYAAKPTMTVPAEHGANAPTRGNAKPSPAMRRTMQAAAAAEDRPSEGTLLTGADDDEFCAVPETHGHEGRPLDDMESRVKGASVPSREELRRAVIWAEILGGRGGRQRTCRL